MICLVFYRCDFVGFCGLCLLFSCACWVVWVIVFVVEFAGGCFVVIVVLDLLGMGLIVCACVRVVFLVCLYCFDDFCGVFYPLD